MAANWQYGFPVTQVNSASLEIYGSTNGTAGPYAHTVTFFPILPVTGGGTVIIKLNGTTVATDDGNGNLTGASISTGSVNYVTGACTITFTTSQTAGSNNLTISYNASTINTTPTWNDDIVFNIVQTMIAAGWAVYGNSDAISFNNAASGSPASQTLKIVNRSVTSTPITTVAAGSNAVNVDTFTGAGTLNVLSASAAGFPTSGTLIVECGDSSPITPCTISYTNTTTSTFTGCTLVTGSGILSTGSGVQQLTNVGTISNYYCWIRLRSPGTLGTTNGHEVLFYHGYAQGSWYIGRSDTNFAGTSFVDTVASGSNTVNVNTFLGAGTLNVTVAPGTAGFPTAGALLVATNNGNQTVYYTGTSGSTFTGCQCAGSGVLTTGNAITSVAAAIWAPTASDQVGMFGTTAAPPNQLFTKAQYDDSITEGTYHSEAAADANSPYGVYAFSFTKSPSANSASFNAFIVDSLTSGSYNSLDTNPYWYFANAAGSVLITPTAANTSATFNGTQSINVIPLAWPSNFQANPYTGKDDLFPTYYYGSAAASPITYKGQGYYYYNDSFTTASRLPGTLLDIVSLNDTVVCNTWCFPWNLLAILLG